MNSLKPIFFLIVLLCASAPLREIHAASPNILLILTDDQGWSQMSSRMDPKVKDSYSNYLETPNMARLMDGGMRFTSGYSPAPLCTPTRRSILCGTTAARSGSEFKSPWVPAEHLTIPKALKAANGNYRCAHFGKWGEQMISTPEECGYDSSDGMTGNNTGGMPRTLGVKGGHNDGPPHFIDNEDPKRTSSITTKAIDFMTQQKKDGHPFYVQVSYYAQHLSVVTSEKMLAKYVAKGTPDRGYPPAWAAMMEELDNGVGRLLDAIDQLGVEGETYVFFTADNGGRGTVPGGDTDRLATNHPLTGAKHSLNEGGIRVPFIAKGPGVPAATTCGTPVAGYDFLATFADLAGGKPNQDENIDSISFKALLMDHKSKDFNRPDKALFFHRPRNRSSAVRLGNYKLMLEWNADNEITERHLYRVDNVPTEEGHEITAENTDKAKQMENFLLKHLKRVKAEKVPPSRKKKK